jgi:hypothetical protein
MISEAPSYTDILTTMATSNLIRLFDTNLTALTNTLNLHHNQKAPIVLRAWRTVQTTQRLVRAAAVDDNADLEELKNWVRLATNLVIDACALNRPPKPTATHSSSDGEAIHPTPLAETNRVGAWLSGVSRTKLEPTQSKIRAWKLGLDIDAECEMDGCACCPAQPLGLGLGSGKAQTRARVLSLAIDVSVDASYTLSYGDLPGVEGEDLYDGGLPTGLTLWSVEAVAGESEGLWREVWGATARHLGDGDPKDSGSAYEMLWRGVWIAAARHLDDACRKGEMVMARGMEDVEVEKLAKHAMRCEECLRELIGM